MLVLIAPGDAGTGEKDENRGENKGKPTTLSPFKSFTVMEPLSVEGFYLCVGCEVRMFSGVQNLPLELFF